MVPCLPLLPCATSEFVSGYTVLFLPWDLGVKPAGIQEKEDFTCFLQVGQLPDFMVALVELQPWTFWQLYFLAPPEICAKSGATLFCFCYSVLP